MQRLLDTPWKARSELERLMLLPWIRLQFALNGIPWGRGWRFYGVPILQRHRRSRMVLGSGLQLRSSARANPLGASHGVVLCTWQANALLEIGDQFGMTGGSIVAAERILIGSRVIVGANSTIIDTDFHPLDPGLRRIRPADAETAPITVEDDVFIGMNSIVLKGVTLGRGCVVGAGSVVSRSVAPGTIVAGNPARVVGEVGQPA